MDLPLLDVHAVEVAATREQLWDALVDALPEALDTRAAALYGRAIACDPPAPAGRFPQAGAALRGFRVARSNPPAELGLEGGHRFSRYALTFHLDARPAGSRLRAVSHAAFPGAAGWLYRAMVLGTGAHVLITRRLLRTVRRRAERTSVASR